MWNTSFERRVAFLKFDYILEAAIESNRPLATDPSKHPYTSTYNTPQSRRDALNIHLTLPPHPPSDSDPPPLRRSTCSCPEVREVNP